MFLCIIDMYYVQYSEVDKYIDCVCDQLGNKKINLIMQYTLLYKQYFGILHVLMIPNGLTRINLMNFVKMK